MNSRIVVTADGSKTLTADEAGTEIYHSRHGALAESRYVFIQQGLQIFLDHAGPASIRLLEVGFGTGLNAMLGMQWAQAHQIPVDYTGLEPNRLSIDLLMALDYPPLLQVPEADFYNLHALSRLEVPCFEATVVTAALESYQGQPGTFDLVWFDAFSPRFQAQIWSAEVFQQLFELLRPGGKLVTYSAKGDVQRALKATGFSLEKLPGPPGKREMLRATRPA